MTQQYGLGRALGVAQGVAGLGQRITNRRAQQQDIATAQMQNEAVAQQQAAAAAQQRQWQELVNRFQQGDQSAMTEMILANPELSGQIREQIGAVDEARASNLQNLALGFRQAAQAGPEAARSYYQQNMAGDPAFAEFADEVQSGQLDRALTEMEAGVAAIGGREALDAFRGPQQEPTAFMQEMAAAGIEPGTPEYRQAVEERYGKGQTIGYDIVEAVNPETGRREYAQVSRTTPGDRQFLGLEVAPDETPTGMERTGQIQSASEAREILQNASSTQAKAGGYAYRLDQSAQELERLESMTDDEGNPVVDVDRRALRMALTPSSDGIMGRFGGMADEVARRRLTPAEQQYMTEAMEFVRSALRQESGAVIGVEEAREEINKYFPRPGDDQATIERKRDLRRRKVQEIAQQSGGTFEAQRYLQRGEDEPEAEMSIDDLVTQYAD